MTLLEEAIELLRRIDEGTQYVTNCPFCGYHVSSRKHSRAYSGPPHEPNCPLYAFLEKVK